MSHLRVRALLTLGVVSAIVPISVAAYGRPGGGQSFGGSPRSSSPSYSSPSWGGSSSPSHSSFGSPSTPSYGGWGSPSHDSSPPSSTPSTPTYVPNPALERMQRVEVCRSECFLKYSATQQTELSSCEAECERNPPPPPPSTYVSTYDYEPRSSSMTAFFLWPTGLLLVAGIMALTIRTMQKRRDAEWASSMSTDIEGSFAPPRAPSGIKSASIEAAIASIRAKDDAFSWVLFEDFVYALYTIAHTLRSTPEAERLSAYFAPAALDSLQALSSSPAKNVIVGAMRIEDVRVEEARADDIPRRVIVRISFESNYTEPVGSFYARETWVISRRADVASRPADRARTIDCPNCGTPLDKIVAGRCGYCHATPGQGNLDWHVDAIEASERESRGPVLIGTTEEVGTDLPTVVDPNVQFRWASLAKKDDAVIWSLFLARVEAVFSAFHVSWSSRDLRGVRPFLSDNLFETQQYWVSAYESEALRNITEDPAIATVQLSRVTSDAHFDAVTVRVYASCKDYTLNAKDQVVGGSRDKERQYSEYWTFIRGAGVRGAPRTDPTCPSCGAPSTEINMAGTCDHCHAKITNGAFDWVLSRIEQDEVYALA